MLNHEQLVAICIRILNYTERLGFIEAICKASSGFAFGLEGLGFHSLAASYHRRALRLAEKSGNPTAIGVVNLLNGIHQFVVGHWDEAVLHLDKAREISASVG